MSEHGRGGLVRARAAQLLALASIGALLIGGLLIPAEPAAAIVQEGRGLGFPGDAVTLTLLAENDAPPTANWNITAPAGTTIQSATPSSATGETTPACTAVEADVHRCAPPAGGWKTDDRVVLVLRIDAEASAGAVQGSSSIATETGVISVEILTPPLPGVSQPTAGELTLSRRPTIQGSKRAGNAVSVRIDGTEVCTAAASAASNWNCTPSSDLAVGRRQLTAVQISPAGDLSLPTTALAFEVVQASTLAVAQSGTAAAVPTLPVTRQVTVTNTGAAVASGTRLTVELGGLVATSCTVGGALVACADLRTGVALGDLAVGQAVTVEIAGSIPEGTAPGSVLSITASASSVSDAASPRRSTAQLSSEGLPAPRILSPLAGSSTVARPTISGDGALAGAQVSVTRGQAAVCTTTAAADGRWSCRSGADLALGTGSLLAVQSIGGVASGPSEAVPYRVVAAPPSPEPSTPGTEEPSPEPGGEGALPLSFEREGLRIAAGSEATLRGVLGPHSGSDTVAVLISGFTAPGVRYLHVGVGQSGECVVDALRFTCTLALDPGAEAVLELQLYAEETVESGLIEQRIIAVASDPALSTSLVFDIPVGGGAAESEPGGGWPDWLSALAVIAVAALLGLATVLVPWWRSSGPAGAPGTAPRAD